MSSAGVAVTASTVTQWLSLLWGCTLQELVDELIASALVHVAMRPSRAVVDLELAEWGVGQPAALAAISRHITDG